MLTPIHPQAAIETLGKAAGVSAALCQMARRMARLFALDAPEAPGLKLAGAVLALSEEEQAAADMAAMSVTGNGLTEAEALTTCFGEAADALSQFERAGDIVGSRRAPKLMSGWLEQAAQGAQEIDWVLAHDAHGGGAVLVPADICLRREQVHRAFSPVGALSSGCAAGPTQEHARARAIYELIERDAAAMWWLGARQGTTLPSSPQIDEMVRHLRAGRASRHVILLDISTEIGVPVIAACSHDMEGFFFACGVACRATSVEAAKAALLEMAQMEMSAPIAGMKAAEQGQAALNPADLRHLARAAMNVTGLPMLKPAPHAWPEAHGPNPAESLAARGYRLACLDLTRPEIGVPVIRAISPDLQPFAENLITPRLATIIAETGGGARHHAGVMPF